MYFRTVDHTTSQLMRMFPDLQVQIMKPYGTSTIIMVLYILALHLSNYDI